MIPITMAPNSAKYAVNNEQVRTMVIVKIISVNEEYRELNTDDLDMEMFGSWRNFADMARTSVWDAMEKEHNFGMLHGFTERDRHR